MEFKIVNAEERHLDALEQIEIACFSVPWSKNSLRAYLPDNMHAFVVAENENGEAVGYVGMMYVLDEGYISNVAVSPDYRRNGIADRLIETLIAQANDKKLSFVTLEVRQSNEPAISLYKKHGFSEVGLRKNYYDKPKENAILMTRFL